LFFQALEVSKTEFFEILTLLKLNGKAAEVKQNN